MQILRFTSAALPIKLFQGHIARDIQMKTNPLVLKKLTSLISLILLIGFTACDRSSDPGDEVLANLQCEIITTCPSPSKFGMIGDSWTDFAFGLELQRDMLDWLRMDGFRITASVVAGHTLRNEVESKRGFIQVINNAGPEIKYMFVSLGGNDMLGSIGEYEANGFETVLLARQTSMEIRLKRLVQEANFYKQQKYGGAPLTFFIHGYDYPNPNLNSSCVLSALTEGATQSEAEDLIRNITNRHNVFLARMDTEIPELHYIDLRATLGGPPVSRSDLMFDCIHPNDAGFQFVANRFALTVDQFTGGIRE